jgi:hypothetical protein
MQARSNPHGAGIDPPTAQDHILQLDRSTQPAPQQRFRIPEADLVYQFRKTLDLGHTNHRIQRVEAGRRRSGGSRQRGKVDAGSSVSWSFGPGYLDTERLGLRTWDGRRSWDHRTARSWMTLIGSATFHWKRWSEVQANGVPGRGMVSGCGVDPSRDGSHDNGDMHEHGNERGMHTRSGDDLGCE